jgi:hypothetical protein
MAIAASTCDLCQAHTPQATTDDAARTVANPVSRIVVTIRTGPADLISGRAGRCPPSTAAAIGDDKRTPTAEAQVLRGADKAITRQASITCRDAYTARTRLRM